MSNIMKTACIVLAAGRSSRMGPANKLLAELEGKPMVRRVVEAAVSSRASPVIVVTGHQAPEVAAALSGCPVSIVLNAEYALGLSSSLKCGIRSVPEDCRGAVIMLGDMPGITAANIDNIISVFESGGGSRIVLPLHNGKRGNPVLWPRRLFPDLLRLEGDVGAKALLVAYEADVETVELATAAIHVDIDTPQDLARARETAAGAKPQP
ncbi:MAG TPA: nucleotidyltransferase family protein [Hyphomicrobiaceae bacterium]|nr:nucleotidyltransferase family protein [Hyphomicrobiaceae bacterium]